MLTIVRLAAVCFGRLGLSGCVCQLVKTLEPLWRKVSTNPKVRCENGDPFELLIHRMDDIIAETSENLINSELVDPANSIFNGIPFTPFPYRESGNPIPRVCFRVHYDPTKCTRGALTFEQANRIAQCEDQSYGLEEMCFFARVTCCHVSP